MACHVENATLWPTNIPELKHLDALLHCGICYELISTCVVTLCSHNYCSLCIRQYLSYKAQCPQCFRETTDQHLRTNRLVDEIVLLYPVLRDHFIRLNQAVAENSLIAFEPKEKPEKSNDAADSSFSKLSIDPKESVTATPGKIFDLQSWRILSGSQVLSSMVGRSEHPSPVFGPSDASSPLTPVRRQFFKHFTSPSCSNYDPVVGSHSAGDSVASNNESVNCPVCHVVIPSRNINMHLDDCLKRSQSSDVVNRSSEPLQRKTMPKLVYSILSDKQLKQKLKENGLQFIGDRQALIKRHQRFTILYNADSDASRPRSAAELVQLIERQEKDESKPSRTIFTYDRKSNPSVIDKGQQEYIKKNQHQFDQLVADVRERRQEVLGQMPIGVKIRLKNNQVTERAPGNKKEDCGVAVCITLDDNNEIIDKTEAKCQRVVENADITEVSSKLSGSSKNITLSPSLHHRNVEHLENVCTDESTKIGNSSAGVLTCAASSQASDDLFADCVLPCSPDNSIDDDPIPSHQPEHSSNSVSLSPELVRRVLRKRSNHISLLPVDDDSVMISVGENIAEEHSVISGDCEETGNDKVAPCPASTKRVRKRKVPMANALSLKLSRKKR